MSDDFKFREYYSIAGRHFEVAEKPARNTSSRNRHTTAGYANSGDGDVAQPAQRADRAEKPDFAERMSGCFA